ncbi:MAG TPA: DUF6265 family protein [Woeseiaceae bacterium]|nr:DUF6265 family protein [Woeseiaceae bacterium]
MAVVLLAGGAGTVQPAPSLDWISGHWCAGLGQDTVEEFWLPPHGGVTIGVSRTLRDGRTAAFEYLRIVDLEGTPSYIAQSGGRPPTAFKRTAGGERWIRFENPEHDFPQRIEYRRDGDTLQAEIAGPGADGSETVIAFEYRRCVPGALPSGLLQP